MARQYRFRPLPNDRVSLASSLSSRLPPTNDTFLPAAYVGRNHSQTHHQILKSPYERRTSRIVLSTQTKQKEVAYRKRFGLAAPLSFRPTVNRRLQNPIQPSPEADT